MTNQQRQSTTTSVLDRESAAIAAERWDLPQSSIAPEMAERGPATITGAAGAAVLASGIGCLAVGVMATLSEASPSLSRSLTFVESVGPLSGKTTVAVVTWLVSWLILHAAWKDQAEKTFRPIFTATLLLIFLGVVGTFPIFFELFAAE